MAKLALALLIVAGAMESLGDSCRVCSCERAYEGSHRTFTLDCSRLHTNDVEGLLGAGGAWNLPPEALPESDLVRLVLDANSIRRLRPLPPLESKLKNVSALRNATTAIAEDSGEEGTSSAALTTSGEPLRLELSFRNNHLSNVDPGAFASLSENLWAIDLSDNDLTYDALPASAFRGRFSTRSYDPLAVLEKLNLARNSLHALDSKVFEHVAGSLRVLNLQGNPLGESLDVVTESAISILKQLRELNLADTGLSSYPEGMAHALQSLEKLRLDGNKFSTVPPALSCTHPQLVYLSLNRNPIRTINNGSFSSPRAEASAWSKLQALDVVAMPMLEVVSEGAFESLVELRVLRCAYNHKLVRFSEEAFRRDEGPGMTWGRWMGFKLKELELQGNALEWLSADVVPWEDLDSANLQSNPWVCDCSLKPLADAVRIHVTKRNPNLSVGLRCAAPPRLVGAYILSTYPANEETFQNPWIGCSRGEVRRIWSRRGAVASALVAVSVAALVSLVTVAFLVAVVRRFIRLERINAPGQVRYVKTPLAGAEDEDEYVIMDMRWAAGGGTAGIGVAGIGIAGMGVAGEGAAGEGATGMDVTGVEVAGGGAAGRGNAVTSPESASEGRTMREYRWPLG